MTTRSVGTFLQQITAWAKTEQGILSLGLVGSQARGTAGPDSDVDLVILARDPQSFLQDTAWLAHFGAVESRQVEDYGRVQSLRVWYRSGLEVEYGLTDAGWATLPLDPGTRRVVADGLRVLWERQPLLAPLMIDK
jgi:predicted nucleotidyltransferase